MGPDVNFGNYRSKNLDKDFEALLSNKFITKLRGTANKLDDRRYVRRGVVVTVNPDLPFTECILSHPELHFPHMSSSYITIIHGSEMAL